MKVIRYTFVALFVLLSVSSLAQRRKQTAPVLTPEQLELQEKIESMRASAAKIMFIDSIVVDKDKFLNYYNLNPESGRLDPYQSIYKTTRQPNGYVYTTENGKNRFASQENNEGVINLYRSEKSDKRWSRLTKVRGINDDRRFSRVNYPFLMGDGQTLYFAAEGPDGIGGYDIYITRYDASGEKFRKPENIGMPFNSEANDYMYAIDEYDSLGWFATDRRQPEGKVCIYTFIPPSIRQTYDSESYTSDEIARYAGISSITATWDDKVALEKALARKRMAALRKHQQVTGREFTFIINDDVTYTRLADFQVAANKTRYRQLDKLNLQYHTLATKLDKVRNYYINSRGDEREDLNEEIIASERKQHELYCQIHDLEKAIRNAENNFLKQKKQ